MQELMRFTWKPWISSPGFHQISPSASLIAIQEFQKIAERLWVLMNNTMNYFETSQPMPYLFELVLASSNCRNRQELDQIVSTMRRIQSMERLYARS